MKWLWQWLQNNYDKYDCFPIWNSGKRLGSSVTKVLLGMLHGCLLMLSLRHHDSTTSQLQNFAYVGTINLRFLLSYVKNCGFLAKVYWTQSLDRKKKMRREKVVERKLLHLILRGVIWYVSISACSSKPVENLHHVLNSFSLLCKTRLYSLQHRRKTVPMSIICRSTCTRYLCLQEKFHLSSTSG